MATIDHSQTARSAAVPEWLKQGETRLRLQTIVRLRWLAVLGQSLTVIGAYWVLGIDLPIGGCLAIIALSAWLNVALRIRYPASQRLKSGYAFVMLAYDILQLAVLEPRLAILDETDSGLDIDALRTVAAGVNRLRRPDNAFIVITHYQRLLNYIVPDYVHVLSDGKVVMSGGKDLALELEAKGYEWVDASAEALTK